MATTCDSENVRRCNTFEFTVAWRMVENFLGMGLLDWHRWGFRGPSGRAPPGHQILSPTA